ncbi:hypothetical protein MTR67_019312 [Solanum verrucosum]|uniref:Uncharacterized protein n=1 Tax=Solanum verrucosum TaxID=315347 RepID=A0AAF0TMC6_SOLVR|nr:hypothetical protein MTR67_019312 [Solanum verrucosum]
MNHLMPYMLKEIKSYLSLKNVAMMTEEIMFEYRDNLLKHLDDLPKYCANLLLPLMSDYKILRQVCGHLRDFYPILVANNTSTEFLYPWFHLTSNRVTQFYFDLWTGKYERDVCCIDYYYKEYEISQCSFEITSLLIDIMPLELEVLYICTSKLMKESRSTELEEFVKQILKASPKILQNYLILIQGCMADTEAVSYAPTQSINVMMKFLLIFLTDIPKCYIHRDKLNDMLAHLEHLNDLLISNAYSVALIQKEIEMVKESLEFLRSSFGKVRQTLDDTSGVVKDCWLEDKNEDDPLDAKSSDESIESTSSSFVERTRTRLCIFEAECSKLEYLTTLSRVYISYSQGTTDALGKFPNLQHFVCNILVSNDPPTNGNWFPKFDVHNKLGSLILSYMYDWSSDNCLDYSEFEKIRSPNEYHFPTSLKELRLHSFPLRPTLLSAIATLLELEIQEIINSDFLEDEWDASEDIYQSLKTLHLADVLFTEWQIDKEMFPKLVELILEHCNELTEIPSAFGDIDSLKSIRVVQTSHHLGNSAIEIKKDVEAYTRGKRLDVHVTNVYYYSSLEESEEEVIS